MIVFDTWAKFSSGLLQGNLHTPGHFIECVKFRHDTIQGQHCMVTLQSKTNDVSTQILNRFDWREVGLTVRQNNLQLVQGFCLPASCSPEKVINYTSTIMSEADLEAIETTCRTNDPVPFKIIDYFAM